MLTNAQLHLQVVGQLRTGMPVDLKALLGADISFQTYFGGEIKLSLKLEGSEVAANAVRIHINSADIFQLLLRAIHVSSFLMDHPSAAGDSSIFRSIARLDRFVSSR